MLDPNDLHKAFSPADNDLLKGGSDHGKTTCRQCGKGMPPYAAACALCGAPRAATYKKAPE